MCFNLLKLQIFALLITIFLFIVLKNKTNDSKILSNFFENITLIGHRGNREKAPENTYIALLRAVEDGINAIEIDVSLTKDEKLILLHDDTLNRTTNCTGLIEKYLLRYLH